MGQTPSTENTTEYIHNCELGTLKGLTFYNELGLPTCHRFTRVRYGAPPTGESRWLKPEALPDSYDYSGTYKEFGLLSPQPAVLTPPMDKVYYRRRGDEDCTCLNIWVPSSDKGKPVNGWPVLIYLYGGFLKFGAPSVTDAYHPNHLFDDENFMDKCIIVAPGYRINLFGFLASRELLEERGSLNYGFWDQRLSIEWCYKNICNFGGDPEKIIVGGVSAGAYSAFFQMAYELYHPEEPQIIKKLALFSNCIFIQPKSVDEMQVQFDELLEKLGIDKSLGNSEKLRLLENLDAEFLVDQINLMQNHTYRAVTDDDFVSPDILKDIVSGHFGSLMKERGIDLLIGETSNEGAKYATFNSPKSIPDLKVQVLNFYPENVCETLFGDLYDLNFNENENGFQDRVKSLFGEIVSDGQVYASSRGFLNLIVKGGFPESKIYRYRVDFLNDYYKPHCPEGLRGVPHGLDVPHWFFALDDGITQEESMHLKEFIKPYLKWLNFKSCEEINWGTKSVQEYREYSRDGVTRILRDPHWTKGLEITDKVYRVQI